MQDHLSDCMEDFRHKAKLDVPLAVKDFKESFCNWCKNGECPHSHKEDLLTQRINTQWKRLCRATQANPLLPKYSNITNLEWEDKTQETLKLEISARKGDWSIPEVSTKKGSPEEKSPIPLRENPQFIPPKGNTIVPTRGIMIGEGNPPKINPKREIKDPWAPPSTDNVNIKPSGVTITFGEGGKING